jgi:hypothetical protein
MIEPPTAEAPIEVPEADLLEQQTPWQEVSEEDAATNGTPPPAVTDRVADEGDVLEQAHAVAAGPDDDDHPYGAAG